MNSSRRRVLRTLLQGCGALCAAAAFGPEAVEAAPNRTLRKYVLLTTQAGDALQLRGTARTEARPSRGREKITVELEAPRSLTGLEVDVYAVNAPLSEDAVFIGSVTFTRHPLKRKAARARLEVKNYDGGALPDGLSPVAGITEFRVTEKDSPADVLLFTNVDPGGDPRDNPGAGRGRREIDLVPTEAGAATETTGKARTEVREDRQKLYIEIQSRRLPLNTVLELRFSHADFGSNLSAGSFLLIDVNGRKEVEVEWDSLNGPFLPPGAIPVNRITSITVIRQSTGQVLLTGVF